VLLLHALLLLMQCDSRVQRVLTALTVYSYKQRKQLQQQQRVQHATEQKYGLHDTVAAA
jgi:hypothetical protein